MELVIYSPRWTNFCIK